MCRKASAARTPAPEHFSWFGTRATKLLLMLERPEVPLHTNGWENDIRCQVTRRKVSAGTRGDLGRDCRGAFLGLAKTDAGARLGILAPSRQAGSRSQGTP
jgi:hypothetical protein